MHEILHESIMKCPVELCNCMHICWHHPVRRYHTIPLHRRPNKERNLFPCISVIFSTLDSFQEEWLSKQGYDEYGSGIICFFIYSVTLFQADIFKECRTVIFWTCLNMIWSIHSYTECAETVWHKLYTLWLLNGIMSSVFCDYILFWNDMYSI